MRADPMGMRLFTRPVASVAWTPASLGSATIAWYDFSDTSTLFTDTAGTTPVTTNGQAIARVNDKSGNGHYLAHGTAGNRPLWNSAGYASFDGTDDFLRSNGFSGSFTMTDGSGQHSTGARAQETATGDYALVNADNVGVARLAQQLRVNAGSYQVIAFDAGGTPYTDSGSAEVTGSFVTLVENTSTTTTEIFVNGSSGGSTAVTGPMFSSAANLSIGSQNDGASNFWAGPVKRVALFNRPLTTGERASLETWLAS